MKRAEIEVIWYLQEADGEACDVHAIAWNHLADIEESRKSLGGGGGGGRSKQGAAAPKDPYPDHTEAARRRLRRAHAAWTSLPTWAAAVLLGRYLPRGLHVPIVHGLGEWTWVAQLLTSVRNRAARERTTPFVVLQGIVSKSKDDALKRQCEAVVQDALERFGAALDAQRESAEADHRARLIAALEGSMPPSQMAAPANRTVLDHKWAAGCVYRCG